MNELTILLRKASDTWPDCDDMMTLVWQPEWLRLLTCRLMRGVFLYFCGRDDIGQDCLPRVLVLICLNQFKQAILDNPCNEIVRYQPRLVERAVARCRRDGSRRKISLTSKFSYMCEVKMSDSYIASQCISLATVRNHSKSCTAIGVCGILTWR